MSGAMRAAPGLLERLLRPGSAAPRDIRLDVAILVATALLLMVPGLGLRDPWAPDEPRFVLIALDMLRSGDWLVPRVGGDLYADKPPLFFWLLASAIGLAGTMRVGFLLPSLMAGLGTTLLVYDLLRRARGREVALAGALLLLLTFQFTWQARHAQIDAVLCFLTTLGLYGLLRHTLLGPAPGWFLCGWFAAGLGVITKGVGFLPLLALVPVAILVRRGWPAAAGRPGALGLAGAGVMLLAIGLWFVPMMFRTSAGGELAAYRNEILFHQTVTRYADAWHHNKPPWYYLTNVVPVLWLPLIALLPWLWPRWRAALRSRDTWTAVLLGWVVIVLVFFSASAGKRSVYVLPALPALAMAAAPWLPELLRARGPRRVAFGLAALLVTVVAAAAAYFALEPARAANMERLYGVAPVLPLSVAAVLGAAWLLALRVRDGWLAYLAVLATYIVLVGLLLFPRLDPIRSGRHLVERMEQASAGIDELGLVAAREQYLLELRRPSVNFGHARWREWRDEAADAAAWLARRPGRALLVPDHVRAECFGKASSVELGRANRETWFLVTGAANEACVARGDAGRAIRYSPPMLP
jgi:4-amino-4-deoxy-L-arabinose transferase-like glycosyltransferase